MSREGRKHYSSEEKIRIVLDGQRGEDSIAEPCRREGISQGIYYKWSKHFMEAVKKQLAGDTARAADVDPLRFHPRMADTYRERVQALITGLGKSRELQMVQAALRALVERIDLYPSAESGSLDIVLAGALSGLLTLALTSRNAKGLTGEGQAFDNIGGLVLVAGVGFEPTTFRL